MRASPSIRDFYRASEWFEHHDNIAKARILAYYSSAIVLTCIIVSLFKALLRMKRPWELSPIVVSLIMFHFVGDVELDTLTSYPISWESLISPSGLLFPFHPLTRYTGPAAYTLVMFGFWEASLFFGWPNLSRLQPYYRTNKDMAAFVLKAGILAYSVDLGVSTDVFLQRENTATPSFAIASFTFIWTVVVLSSFILSLVHASSLLSKAVLCRDERANVAMEPIYLFNAVNTDIGRPQSLLDATGALPVSPASEESEIPEIPGSDEEMEFPKRIRPKNFDFGVKSSSSVPAGQRSSGSDRLLAPVRKETSIPPVDIPQTTPTLGGFNKTGKISMKRRPLPDGSETTNHSPLSPPSDAHDSIHSQVESLTQAELIQPLASPPRERSSNNRVVPLWNGTLSFQFRSDNFLRGPTHCDLFNAQDMRSFIEMGKYLIGHLHKANRAELSCASTVLNKYGFLVDETQDSSSHINVGKLTVNHFRAILWLGQAFLTAFPRQTTEQVVYEIPIEAIVKASGYSPDGFNASGILPEPNETWDSYLKRLRSATAEELGVDACHGMSMQEGRTQGKAADMRKAKELYRWLERYVAGRRDLLERPVPRVERWSPGISLDINRVVYRQMQSLMLLPPYESRVEEAIKARKERHALQLSRSVTSAPASKRTGSGSSKGKPREKYANSASTEHGASKSLHQSDAL